MDRTLPPKLPESAASGPADEAIAGAHAPDALEATPAQPSTGATMRSALVWNGANLIANQIAGAVIFFILAAELPPAVFGVLALALLYTDFFTAQGAAAVRDALVQRQDFSSKSLSTMFWCSSAFAGIAAAIGCAAAPFAAEAFRAPQLLHVLPALSLSILLSPAIAVMEALVMRRLHFKALAIRNISAVWIGGAVGLAVVFGPYAEWALVAQRLTQMVFSVLFLLIHTRWMPTVEFDRPMARDYSKATGQLWSMQVVSVSGLQFVDAMIGWRLGPATLGLTRVARKFVEIVHASLTSSVMSIWVPLLSRVAHDPVQRGEMFLKLMQFGAMICMPPMIGLSLVAEDLTQAVLEESYRETGVALAIMGLSGVYIPLTYFRSAVLTALSRNSLSLKVALFDLAFISAVVFWFSQYGLEATLLSVTFGAVFTTSISAFFTVRAVGVPVRAFAQAVAPAYFALLAMALSVLAFAWVSADWGLHHWATLPLKTVIGAAAYGGWLWLFHRPWLMQNVRFILERH